MRILLIRYSSLGDVVLAGAVPRAIQRAYPDAHITFMTKYQYKPVVEHFDARLTVVDIGPEDSIRQANRRVGGQHFHAVIDLHSSLRSVFTAWKPRAFRRVRIPKHARRRREMVRRKTGLDQPLSVVRNYLETARRVFPDLGDFEPKLVLTPEERLVAEALHEQLPGAVGVGWGARWLTKAVPVELWTLVCERLQRSGVRSLRLFGLEHERPLMESFVKDAQARGMKLNFVIHADLSLPELMCHLRACSVCIGPDSGIMHLSAALGVPTVAVFGPTHPSLGFAPVGVHTRAVHAGTWCSPCHKHGAAACFRERRFCFEDINPEFITSAIHELLPWDRITT